MSTVTQRFRESREQLEEFGKHLRDRAEAFQHRQARAAGRIWDESIDAFFELGETVLDSASKLTGRFSSLDETTRRMRSYASDARAELKQPPIDDYDELNVRQVNAALDGLSPWELEKVRIYEEAHKDRVTILREIERRQA